MCKQNKKTLYLECRSGISGDMAVAALLDLGASEQYLKHNLELLHISGYEISITRKNIMGIEACDFEVRITEPLPEEHCHTHVTWKEINQLLEQAGLPEHVYEISKKLFLIIAKAEGKVHGKETEEVQFHEVGAVDSIVDIVAVASCLDNLGIDRIMASPISEGSGHIRCRHGSLPVPVPAVLEIASGHHLILERTEIKGELVTPTGAAIAALSNGFMPEAYRVNKIGIGAGKKMYPHANILRAMLIDCEDISM